MDDHAPAHLGRPGLAARAVGRPDDAQGHQPAGRRAPRGGCRDERDLGVKPRRQQPRLHPRLDPVLPDIADAVGDQLEVLLDGGIRRGSDVAKALALGARAVLIGRAYLWGLAANGQAGVENVLDILRGGLDSAMYGMARARLDELCRDDLWIPADFRRRLGAAVPGRALPARDSSAVVG
ncbi:alpha-hydroxy-acid oxidizing protein [Microbacterium elymi]|uniref:Alpha-hydroxy-acid oxidizing protein n=1 Tax=Microbacterium elymi TaxID=2909587 RepID=A0ABY5NIG2_9MICO|nr:alpha-hydroxy-acid oxidizing protein [Microbacterium elymi]UUT34886.1 alpha-hydroxy-acid oxidizing protein [Microbacterium elymi]